MDQGTSHPEQFIRYAPFYRFLFDLDVPIEVVTSRTKRIVFGTALKSRLMTLHHVEAALDWAGQSLGGVTHQSDMPGINPHGVANLDIDHEGLGFDLSPFKLMIRRTGESTRAQYLFRVPEPASQLNGSQHGTHDVCTWLFLLPGSIHKTGSLYELWIKEDGEWQPWDGQELSLEMLPVIDPDQFRVTPSLPALEVLGIEASKKPRQMIAIRRSRRTRQAPSVFVTATVSFETRIVKAKYYLRYQAWRSVSGIRGHSSLLVAASNLRLYFCLPKHICLSLIKEHFNPRCLDSDGKPAPWSDKEIEHKYEQAGKPGMYPTLGEADIKAVCKVRANDLRAEVQKFLMEYTVEGGACNPTMLRDAFLVWRGGVDVTQTAFGLAVSKATGIKSSHHLGHRVYRGFQLSTAGLRLITHGLVETACAA
jgi:hypothetical protein